MEKKYNDPKYLGIPNICFSIDIPNIEPKEEEYFANQRMERGFDDTEMWYLYSTITNFILPRLKRYQEIADERIIRDQQLKDNVDSFLKAMELVAAKNNFSKDEKVQIFKGLNNFSKIFFSLWA
jgi:hypothetical protein